MKIASYRTPNGDVRAAVVEPDGTVRDAGTDPLSPTAGGAPVGGLADVALEAPIPRPGKIICVGLNYRDHAEETGATLPERPLLFAKLANAVVGPGAAIEIPAESDQVDYEAELAVVIGRTARRASPAEALDHVFGYTCANDVSARDLQLGDGQWFRGKSQDTFCPLGPWIVTADEIPDPQALGIRCRVDGELLQDSSTAHMVFGVADIVSAVSQGITLEPGDVILTGTPAGVGFTRTPPVLLRPGSTVVVEIDGIGALENPVAARA